MIPLQDVVPSGRTPAATLALIAVTVVGCASQLLPPSVGFETPLAGFFAVNAVHCGINVLALWLFGDNVEARLGRPWLVGLYVCGASVGAVVAPLLSDGPAAPGVPASAAAAGVLGAYIVLLPHARVLTLVPARPLLVEVPAAAVLAFWWLAQVILLVVRPAAQLEPASAAPMWTLAAALALGALVGRLRRRPIRW